MANSRDKGAERIRTAVCGVSSTDSEKSSLIYAVQAERGGPVKLGFVSSADLLDGRLRALQCGSPWRLRVIWTKPGTQKEERRLHRRFDGLRLVGEWFRPLDSLVELTGAKREGSDDLNKAFEDGYALGLMHGETGYNDGFPDEHGVFFWEHEELYRMARS